jgi:hypothetical protein
MDVFALRAAVVTAAWWLVGLLGVLVLFGWSRRVAGVESRLREEVEATRAGVAEVAAFCGDRAGRLERRVFQVGLRVEDAERCAWSALERVRLVPDAEDATT